MAEREVVTVSLLEEQDVEAFLAHVGRHAPESGRNGAPIFHPHPRDAPWDPVSKREPTLARWRAAVGELDWERAWGVWAIDRTGAAAIVGHVDLRGGRLLSSMHRARLGMGIEEGFRGRGLGRLRMEAAIAWGYAQRLKWIDLGVFAHNTAARSLYERCGFVETGRVADLFRVDGASIDDVQMSLKLS
jgi:RimJ/RimL family protein N-acetyltransferase